MHNTKHIHKNLIERFSEPEKVEASTHHIAWEAPGRQAQHLKQFFKMAEHRKRQILEKMLMD